MNALQEYGLRDAAVKTRDLASQLEALSAPRRAALESGEPVQKVLLAALEDNVHNACPYTWDRNQQIAEQVGRRAAPGCVYVDEHRVLQAGTGAGASLKGVDVAGFGDSAGLDPSLADTLGVERVPMVADGAFPKIATGITTSWLTNETTQLSASDPVLGVATVAPKRTGGYFEASEQLFKQASPSGVAFLIRELTREVRHAEGAALVNGAGTEQPVGIISTGGVGNQSGTSLAWTGIIEMLRLVETAGRFNPNRAAWLLDATAAKLMRTRERAAGAGLILNNGEIGGYRALVTTAMPSGSVIFGDFAQVVMPTWGVLQLGANPYQSGNFRAGIVGLRVISTIDVAVLRPGSFAKSTSVT